MKIKKLWVSRYNNLVDQWFEFEDDPLITLLIGKNGLGKSNLIEAITIIIRDLDLAKDEEYFTKTTSKEFFDFDITYQCKGNELQIKAIEQKLEILLNGNQIEFRQFLKEKDNKYLPDNIFVYYSGENKRLKSLLYRHSSLRENRLKSGKTQLNRLLEKVFYIQEDYSQLLFLTLWIVKNHSDFSELIEELFFEYAGIENTSSIQIVLCNPDFYNVKNHTGVEKFESSGYSEFGRFWNLSGDVLRFIELLIQNQMSTSAPPMYRDENEVEVDGVDEFIVLNNLDFESLSQSFLEEFKDPVRIFDVIEAAHRMRLFWNITTQIVKNGQSIKHDFNGLSEGELQLTSVLGLILLTSKSDALYLLDEPDTHLNPNWQRDYSYLLKRYDTIHENSQMIVSTHSPLIVQSAEKADIFLFKKGEEKIIVDKNTHRIHNWRIDQVLVSEYFGLESARPTSLDFYIQLKERIINTYPMSNKDAEALKELEDEYGVLPTGETLTEIKAMQLINHIASKINDPDK
ncbi:MAG: AAA family ATPase [Flavobacteriaceae bacterium]|nr:AAA family ATPase [Flavobacteriaceae bacterium]